MKAAAQDMSTICRYFTNIVKNEEKRRNIEIIPKSSKMAGVSPIY